MASRKVSILTSNQAHAGERSRALLAWSVDVYALQLSICAGLLLYFVILVVHKALLTGVHVIVASSNSENFQNITSHK